MSTAPERLDELLALEATQGLAPAEAAELDALLAAFPDEDPDSLARAAAAVHLALSRPPEPLPAHLAERLFRAAASSPLGPTVPARRRPKPAWVTWAGWGAAACLAVVLALTLRPRHEPALAELKRALEPTAAKFGGARAGAAGEVVWSTARQEGYLEVRGLPPLDPATECYQLWIVDPAQKYPVDGGVFDIKADGTALVRVRAPIRVSDAKAFAVTKETAGGVVVSAGPHLLVLTPEPGP